MKMFRSRNDDVHNDNICLFLALYCKGDGNETSEVIKLITNTGDDNYIGIYDANYDNDDTDNVHLSLQCIALVMMMVMMTPRLGSTRGGRAEVMVRATTGRRAGSRKGCSREIQKYRFHKSKSKYRIVRREIQTR